eukprot:5215186-Karenia_brevis.AAC.1
MLKRCGDSTPPSRTPRLSEKGNPTRSRSKGMPVDRSNIARMSLHSPQEQPHFIIFHNKMDLLIEGKAERRSTKSTYSRRPEPMRSITRASRTKIAS